MTTAMETRREYSFPGFKQLRDERVALARRQQKLREADRAENLVLALDAEKVYLFADLYQWVTLRRPDALGDARLSGAEAQHDLQLFIEDVTDSANVRADAVGERVLTTRQLARELNVSTKTIARWRRRGLVSRRFVFDNHKQLGFLQSSVDRFVARHRDRVERGSRFSHQTEEQRRELVERARNLALTGVSPAEVIKRLARSAGRSTEAVRYTLRRFDQLHPERAVFAEDPDEMHPETKHRIWQQFRRGDSVEAIAKRLCRTRRSIEAVILEMRARRVMELPLDYIASPEFARAMEDPKLEEEVLAPAPGGGPAPKRPSVARDLPPYLASLYEVPLLTREQEAHLFRKLNYLRSKAASYRDRLDPSEPKPGLLDRIERLYERSVATKNEIIRANLRLVVSLARRYVGPTQTFFELVSDGNMSLMRAVDKFDYTRGVKFSTYASWAIMKNYARTIPAEHRQQERFRTGQEDSLPTVADARSDPQKQQALHTQWKAEIQRLLSRLDEREQQIIAHRFGLAPESGPHTLKEVGALMGVTKERVRQIEARALAKLREAAAEQRVTFPL